MAGNGLGGTTGGEQRGLRRVVAAVASGIMVVDGSGRVRFANPAACELFGRPLSELIATEFGFPVVAGEAAEVEVRTPDGETRVVEMHVTTTSWNGESVYVMSLRDVTGRAEAGQELSAVPTSLDVEFGSVSQDVRALLTAIVADSSSLREDWGAIPDSQKLEFVVRIEHDAARIERLLELLAVVRGPAGVAIRGPVAFDVAELVASCIAGIGDRAVEVRVACPAGLLAYADPDQVSEILGRYLENALKHGEPPFEVFGVARQGSVEVRVCDHGPGVARELIPRLFERFGREPEAAARAPGTGLGLPLAASFARVNGGEAWYERNEPRGACFCMRVPRLPGDAPFTAAGTAERGGGL